MTEPPPAMEIDIPDITPFRWGNTGVDYVTTLDSGEPGPHVVINGLSHGNEVCGAVAVDALFRLGLRPRRGRLTLVLANVEAYAAFDPAHPYASRYLDEDFNRLWAPEILDGPGDSVELRRARALRPVYDSADLLLDIHSMTNDTDPLILCGRTRRGLDLAQEMGFPAWIVADAGHAAGPRLIDYGRFAAPDGDSTALLVECGQHWGAETGAMAIEVSLRFLRALGMVDPADVAHHVPVREERPHLVEVTDVVTAHSDNFDFAERFVGLEIVPHAGMIIGYDGTETVATPYDDCVLIMPARRVKAGQTVVRLGRIMSR